MRKVAYIVVSIDRWAGAGVVRAPALQVPPPRHPRPPGRLTRHPATGPPPPNDV